ncbi:mechanosensitive ion channel [Luteimonas sp. RD2P54]|uniref:Mechanosensitive ion channel n=1 Tax=Luteimonas endophytica TaxID=3042023 RepID=A0ABT6JDE1_9GAMM|nr:mechanosensitive ion channel domain-containing protein [Luteimonas endophytica]MDH5824838.1 mechanosensitive ion channel [Luteimonas endophytica]
MSAAASPVVEASARSIVGLRALLDYPLLRVSEVTVTPGTVSAALLALLLAWLVSVLLRRGIRRYGNRHPNANQASLYTVSRLVHYLVLALGVLLALETTGIPVGKFAVFAGALGVGLGFGLQAIFSNFVAGLILLFDRSLKVGDFVELDAELRGTVRAINIRATLITTNDNIDVIVPNSEFVSGRVVNWTHGSVNRRIRVRFGVAYGVDKELVKKAALEAAAQVPFTLATEGDKRPQVWLVNFGDSAVEFILAVWLNEAAARRNAAIEAAYLWELDSALKRHGIAIPFPQRDLHLRSLFGMEGAAAAAALRGERVDAAAAGEAPASALHPRERAELSRNDARDEAGRPPGDPDGPVAAEDDGRDPDR